MVDCVQRENKMRVLVCGDRKWSNCDLIFEWLLALRDKYGIDLIVIDGAARGADSCAFNATVPLEVKSVRFPANWAKYGRAAGAIRNQQMLDEGKPDLVLAFHNDIENSKGTKDMVARARKAGILVEVISHAKPA
jgi:hypothetical protein